MKRTGIAIGVLVLLVPAAGLAALVFPSSSGRDSAQRGAGGAVASADTDPIPGHPTLAHQAAGATGSAADGSDALPFPPMLGRIRPGSEADGMSASGDGGGILPDRGPAPSSGSDAAHPAAAAGEGAGAPLPERSPGKDGPAVAGTEPAIRVDAGLLHVPYPEVPAAFQAEPGTLRMVSPGPVELTFVGAGAGEVLIDGRSVEAGIPVQVVDGAAIAIPRAVGVHIRPPGSGPLPPDGPG